MTADQLFKIGDIVEANLPISGGHPVVKVNKKTVIVEVEGNWVKRHLRKHNVRLHKDSVREVQLDQGHLHT